MRCHALQPEAVNWFRREEAPSVAPQREIEQAIDSNDALLAVLNETADRRPGPPQSRLPGNARDFGGPPKDVSETGLFRWWR